MEVSGRKEDNLNVSEILCQPCKGDGDKVPADGYCENCNEYFCTSCLKVHRKMAVTKNHSIKSKSDMPLQPERADPCTEPCLRHKSEIAKYYCLQHDLVGCGDCMVIEHKICTVSQISEVSGNFANSKEFIDTKTKMENLSRTISDIKKEIKNNLQCASDMKSKITDEIKSYKKELNTYLDQIETNLLKEVDVIHSKDVAQQSDCLDRCDELETEIHQFQHKLLKQEGKANQLFVTIKHARKQLEALNDSVECISREKVVESYKFVPSERMHVIKTSNNPLGEVCVRRKKIVGDAETSLVDVKAEFIRQINVQIENESECVITGMTMISDSEILLADHNNKLLKILDISNNTIVSKFKPPSAPWDVTVIDSNTSAATLPEGEKIIFVDTKEGLRERRSITVKRWCRGIDCHADKIAVSYTSLPASVEILNMKGEILHHTNFPTDYNYFPDYLHFSHDGENIFMSDCIDGTLHVYTVKGQLNKRIFENLNGPRGLISRKDGTILVCCGDVGEKLYVINLQKKTVFPLFVSYMQSPLSVLICERTSKIFISDNMDRCGNIRLFDLK